VKVFGFTLAVLQIFYFDFRMYMIIFHFRDSHELKIWFVETFTYLKKS